jgi:hypothetical protein
MARAHARGVSLDRYLQELAAKKAQLSRRHDDGRRSNPLD